MRNVAERFFHKIRDKTRQICDSLSQTDSRSMETNPCNEAIIALQKGSTVARRIPTIKRTLLIHATAHLEKENTLAQSGQAVLPYCMAKAAVTYCAFFMPEQLLLVWKYFPPAVANT